MISNKEWLNLFLKIEVLKKIKRTGWMLKGIKNVKSVAEHSYRVAMLALLLGEKFNLDKFKLVKMSLIHDLGEALVGDYQVGARNKSY